MKQKSSEAPGRKTDYSEEFAAEICAAISTNACGLDALIAKSEYAHFPAKISIYRWIGKYPEFAKKVDEAMTARCLPFFDLMIDVAMDCKRERISKDEIMRDTLLVNTLKWTLQNLMRHKFGSNAEVEIMELRKELEEIRKLKPTCKQ